MPEEEEQREKLGAVIQRWNNNRLDLFEITPPDKNLEFHGVMRFYFEDRATGNVATKCLRVSSKSSTCEVIDTLAEKFRPDMKMLTTCYSLHEVHGDEERQLDLSEKPLVVQLNWNSREGRFVLKSDTTQENCHDRKERGGVIQNFRRTLTRKDIKNKEKKKTKHGDEDGSNEKPTNNSTSGSQRERTHRSTESMKQERTQSDTGEVYTAGLRTNDLEPGLPIGIGFSHKSEDAFLSAVINYTHSSTVHFRLSPAYALYAAARFSLQRLRSSRHSETTSVINKMAVMTGSVLRKQQVIAGALAFWMANASELLNFIKQDEDLCPLTQQAQEDLSRLVHRAFKCLLQCLQNELKKHMPTFLIDPEQHGPLPAGIEMVLNTLMNTMSLLRRCRVNPALTIQLFSQLFHFISAWLFNQLVGPEAGGLGLRCHYWGATLRQRLSAIEAWAERQGLELAADCHLGHIVQATMLLTMNKYSMQDAKDIQNTCFKMNSLQLQTLMTTYLYATNEPRIPPGLIDVVVAAAEMSADNPVRSEGRSVQLEESLDLRLPFLLPEGGYSCDSARGIPPGFREFMEPICCKGLCYLINQPNFKGSWTVFFSETAPPTGSTDVAAHGEPEIVTITLRKPLNSGMGVSIVAAKAAGGGKLGIYVKSIVAGGPADMDGRLTAGDQLLSVDGKSLLGLTQESAAGIMMQTRPVVTLQVAKLGACYHGLEALLSQAPPETNTGDNGPGGGSGPGGAEPNGKALVLHRSLDHGPSEQWEQQHGAGSRRRKEQTMMRNRQLYRSNPNMTDPVYEDGEEPVDPLPTVSTINLCTDTYQREYLTLPAPRSQDKKRSSEDGQRQTFKVSLSPLEGQSTNKRTFMRQALSQENLSVDSGGPLLDKQGNAWEDQRANYSSFPMRPCTSTSDILSDYSSPTKRQQDGRKGGGGGAGFWRAPVSLNPPPATPSVQPIRIDIPVTRAGSVQANPQLTTFRHNSALLAAKLTQQHPRGGRQTPPEVQNPPSRLQGRHIYACPAAKRPPSLPPQAPITSKDPEPKPQVTIAPTKHVSFQELPVPEQQQQAPARQKDPQYFAMMTDSDGLSPDPWRREAKEKREEQRRLQGVDLLEREVEELRAKAAGRTVEEDERLRRLSLEWRFQKRLQEYQQSGEGEEEDEDMDMMMTIQQLDTRAQRQDKGGSRAQQDSEVRRLDVPVTTHLREDVKTKTTSDQKSSAFEEDIHKLASKESQEKFKRGRAPENLTFKERQRLFSPVSTASIKVKAL